MSWDSGVIGAAAPVTDALPRYRLACDAVRGLPEVTLGLSVACPQRVCFK